MLEGNTFKETKVQDYMPQIEAKFPKVDPKDLRKIVDYGWRMYYSAHLQGCDTLFISHKHKYWFYTGFLTTSSLKHFAYYQRRLANKIKFLYRKKKPKLPLIYYAGLTMKEYEDYMKQMKKTGRKKKYWQFKRKLCYRVLDACIASSSYVAFIEFSVLSDKGFSFYKETLKCEYPKLVFVRDHYPTFQDILVINNNYALL